jgi:hypothetical protein
MNSYLRAFPFVAAVAALTVFAGSASAEVGKTISVASGGSGIIAASPASTSSLAVAVPTGYKSKSNFLKVTTTYQAACNGGDSMSSRINVGGVYMVDSGFPTETLDEDADQQIVSKTYYLVPENQSGPAVPPGSTVTLELTSQLGTGCTANYGTMVVQVAK